MIDLKKRSALKFISGVAAAAAVPPLLATPSMAATSKALTAEASVALPGTGVVLSFSAPSSIGQRTVTITNTTADEVALKHVYPGIVSVGDQRFDVNQVLAQGGCEVPGGQSRTLRIEPFTDHRDECQIPDGLQNSTPIQVKSRYRTQESESTVSTTRSFYV